MFKGLDHLAIVVPDTEEALKIWRDRFGFPVLLSEAVNNNTTLLTHLDLGNTHLQLVQPLTEDHPLWAWLKANGPGLHHFCLFVDNVETTMEALPDRNLASAQPKPHQGTKGKRALFIDPTTTDNIRVEITGA
jgi:methylmalonyl-CoA/ethylmalonyl-CoA epimerase